MSHVGSLARLEDQLTTWDPATGRDSPDRLDALVYAVTVDGLRADDRNASEACSLRAVVGLLRHAAPHELRDHPSPMDRIQRRLGAGLTPQSITVTQRAADEGHGVVGRPSDESG